MTRYYVYDNASRRLKSGKFTYSFDVIEQFAGNWRGVLQLDNQDEIDELAKFGPRLGVKEITLEEFNNLLKKKRNSSLVSPGTTRPPALALQEAAGHAVVVKETPSSPTTPKIVIAPAVEDAIKIGVAPFVDVLETHAAKRRKK